MGKGIRKFVQIQSVSFSLQKVFRVRKGASAYTTHNSTDQG